MEIGWKDIYFHPYPETGTSHCMLATGLCRNVSTGHESRWKTLLSSKMISLTLVPTHSQEPATDYLMSFHKCFIYIKSGNATVENMQVNFSFSSKAIIFITIHMWHLYIFINIWNAVSKFSYICMYIYKLSKNMPFPCSYLQWNSLWANSAFFLLFTQHSERIYWWLSFCLSSLQFKKMDAYSY